jgi:hypothetical protein
MVVNDFVANVHGRTILRKRSLDDIDRADYTGTEAARLCEYYAHGDHHARATKKTIEGIIGQALACTLARSVIPAIMPFCVLSDKSFIDGTHGVVGLRSRIMPLA